MSTVQEAASLFGSGLDEGLDPFGSVLDSSVNPAQNPNPLPQTSPAPSTNLNATSTQGKVPTSNAHDYRPADDLFSGTLADGTDGLFGAGGASDSEWLGTENANADPCDTQGGYSDYSNNTNAGSFGVVNQTQGWSGYEQVEHHQYQAYGAGKYLPSRL